MSQSTAPDFPQKDKEAIERFSNGLKFKTISHSDTSLNDFKEFDGFINHLKKSYPLVFKETEFQEIGDYTLLFKLEGEVNNQKPIILIAHYDVVPIANEADWKHPPFSGHFDGENFYSRGALDDKASLFAIMETLDTLLEEDFTPQNDIYIAFSPDEETGGKIGAPSVVEYFKNKNITFDHVLDEGGRIVQKNGKNYALIGINEKGRLLTKITISATGGHASIPPENSAVEQLAQLVTEFQKQPMGKAKHFQTRENYAKTHTTLAITMVEGSNAPNVVPKEASITIDSRIVPDQSVEDVKKHIAKIIDKRQNVKVEYLTEVEPSKISNINSISYQNLKSLIEEMYPGADVEPFLSLGATDARTYGEICDNTYRFLPAVISDEEHALMHADNEQLSLASYLQMISFYKNYLKKY